MPFHQHTLPNGLTIIGETSPPAKSAAVGFFVRTGSRDETPEVAGVSHFLEHMVFKGTPASITALTRQQMATYHARRYVAPNITVAAAGRFDFDRLVELVSKACGEWESGAVGRQGVRQTAGSRQSGVVTKDRFLQEQ